MTSDTSASVVFAGCRSGTPRRSSSPFYRRPRYRLLYCIYFKAVPRRSRRQPPASAICHLATSARGSSSAAVQQKSLLLRSRLRPCFHFTVRPITTRLDSTRPQRPNPVFCLGHCLSQRSSHHASHTTSSSDCCLRAFAGQRSSPRPTVTPGCM